MSRVGLIRCQDYDRYRVQAAVDAAIAHLGGYAAFLKPGETVLIKPNLLVAAPPDAAVTTHPEVVRAVILGCQAAGAKVRVGDSPGFGNPEQVADKTGILAICRETGAEWVTFDSITEVACPAGRLIKRFPLASAVVGADKVISVAKFKTHGLTKYTGAVKNLYGTIVGMNKAQLHLRVQNIDDFGYLLTDIHELVKPALSIIDAVVGMEGEGPRNGRPRHVGLIMASDNAFALDTIGASIMGLTPQRVPYLAAAIDRGLLSADLSTIEVKGEDPATVRIDRFALGSTAADVVAGMPKWLTNILRKGVTARPIIKENCIGCNICGQSCPPKAIEMRDKHAVIDDKKCIRCYCCHEMCPRGAIDLAAGPLARFLTK